MNEHVLRIYIEFPNNNSGQRYWDNFYHYHRYKSFNTQWQSGNVLFIRYTVHLKLIYKNTFVI